MVENGKMGNPSDLAVCAIAKHENEYMAEWAAHQFAVGFDRIYLFDDNEDGYPDVRKVPGVDAFVADGRMVVLGMLPEGCWHSKDWGWKQCACYEWLYAHAAFSWIAFLDCDEFLVLKGGATLRGLLGSEWCASPQVRSIIVPWVIYDDNGLVRKDPRPVMERFTHASSWNDTTPYAIGKPIVKGGITGMKMYSPHQINDEKYKFLPDGSRVGIDDPTPKETSVAQLNHYFTKSTEEYVGKVRRGDAARGVLRDYWEYWGYCERTPEKEEFFRSLGADPFVQTKTLH